MRSYTYHLRSLLRPLAFAPSLALLTSAPTLLGMEGGGMIFASRNGMVVSKPLPYDAEVEYLESTGTQVIDLGFKGSNNTSFDIQMYRPSDSVTASFGANSGWGRNICQFVTGNGWLYWMYGSSVGSTYVSNSANYVGVLNFIGTADTLVATNMTTQTSYTKVSTGPTPFTTDWNLCVFGTSENGSYGYCGSGLRVYYAKVDDGDNHVDLIPVRFTNELSQSEGAMYDRVSGQLFRNAGTGAFVFPTA